jgi:hypothetical protein
LGRSKRKVIIPQLQFFVKTPDHFLAALYAGPGLA